MTKTDRASGEDIAAMAARQARPIWWRDAEGAKTCGATCFFLRSPSRPIGVTAAHVVRSFEAAKAGKAPPVCRIGLAPFDLEGALIDIDDGLDVATFAISESALAASGIVPFDAPSRLQAVEPGAVVQLIGYPESSRMIEPSDHSAGFRPWSALASVEDVTERQIIVAYDPRKAFPALGEPPLGYEMSGCSGGPAIVCADRGGAQCRRPVGLITRGPRLGERDVAELGVVRLARIDRIGPDGRIRRASETGRARW